jgi:hypothetical protein
MLERLLYILIEEIAVNEPIVRKYIGPPKFVQGKVAILAL